MPAYAIFSYHVNRAKSSSSNLDKSSSPKDESSLHAYLSKDSTVNSGFSLSLRRSNMTVLEEQIALRDFLIKRMLKGPIYEGTGQTTKINATTCFYCLVRPNTKETDKEMAAPSESPATSPDTSMNFRAPPESIMVDTFYSSQEYIICFLNEFFNSDDDGFDLFRPELDAYCQKISGLLSKIDFDAADPKNPSPLDQELTRLLENWFMWNLEYVDRCVNIFSGKLDSLLYFALEGHRIRIYANRIVFEDIEKFYISASVFQLLSEASSTDRCVYGGETENLDDTQFGGESEVIVSVHDDGISFSTEATNDFCMEWSYRLQTNLKEFQSMKPEHAQGAAYSPSLLLRRIIENYKIKAIQDVNYSKRLIRKAEVDHYSLYQCFKYLQTHNNCSILLGILLNDAKELERSEQSVEVIRILQEFLGQGKGDN
eukprot:NODE_478_length_1458_cov_87.937641_g445_i0.p1 GENE.NODE_478_length_1458_cov_87.937641_g445_i0~~NODE_478_length_1458_cov_87.937641_g445_i0.p1  ORF type:complete len:437 (-),score=82.76 NODE_478_length_1458_cov_87.937641_g445_i0:147-1430(-)